MADYTTFQTSSGRFVRLYAAGTKAADVPAAARGLAFDEWEQHMRAVERTAAFHWFARFGCPIERSGIECRRVNPKFPEIER